MIPICAEPVEAIREHHLPCGAGMNLRHFRARKTQSLIFAFRRLSLTY